MKCLHVLFKRTTDFISFAKTLKEKYEKYEIDVCRYLPTIVLRMQYTSEKGVGRKS